MVFFSLPWYSVSRLSQQGICLAPPVPVHTWSHDAVLGQTDKVTWLNAGSVKPKGKEHVVPLHYHQSSFWFEVSWARSQCVWLEKCSLQDLSPGGPWLFTLSSGQPKSAAKVCHDPYPGPSTGPGELFMQQAWQAPSLPADSHMK